MTTPHHPGRPAISGSTAGRVSPFRRWAILFLSLMLGMAGLAALAGPSAAVTVYEIEGDWAANTPATVAKGDVVTSEWRINVNDDRPAPSNDPVENVTFTVTLEHGLFKALPDLCVTGAAYDPASSLSADGRTLVCNLGAVKQGTALVVQAPVVADGVTGDQITASGTIAGQTDDLSPIDIVNTFGMDMLWGTPTATTIDRTGDAIGFDFEWTLFQDEGSDAGPNSVVYNIDIPLQNGMRLYPSQQTNWAPFDQPCTPFSQSASAEGHPYSLGGTAANRSPFVESCELVQTGPNSFRMTLTGIDYSLTQVPTEDSAGNPLPSDRVAVASGSIWLEVRGLTAATSANLTASAPTYTSVTGQSDPDETANNTSSKAIVFPGTWSHHHLRQGGGTAWDNTFKLAPGTTVVDQTHDTIASTGVPAGYAMGDCAILDAAYVDYDSVALHAWTAGDGIGDPDDLGTMAWYVGNDPTVTPGSGGYNPDAFTGCGSSVGWVTIEPADKTTVKAVRWTSTAGVVGDQHIVLRVATTVQADAPIGQDIWTWGAVVRDGVWLYPSREGSGQIITPTPGDRYSGTNGARDVLHVIFAVPAIAKRADRQVVRPGVPATFTLTYSANGSGTIPPTVDDYQVLDTLPAGMTYVPGSATPEPTVTTTGGRQVLTWNLDGVPTNAAQTLTYQAVADESVTPGQTLTNTATSSLRGETSRPASAQVTVSTNGYTEISKTADTPFIPNLDGSGDGEGSWTVSVRSFDPLPQAFTDTIDILPFEGDARGTDYDGEYSLVAVEPSPAANVFYTNAAPTTISDDPADASNGAAGNPVGNTIGWSPVYTPDATAVRVIGPRLDPSEVQQFKVRIATDGADGQDRFVNRAQGRAGHTELVMRTSAPMTVAQYYAASLKKYVQDAKGVWHDANDVTDYPAFRYGDTVRYRLVVTNVGQGTITNLDISDDQQPELGNFHIDSLAPGEEESHEYEFELTTETNGTVVNTACAKADVPADSQVPPTINCDPAGFEVANYTTVKSSDPKPGSPVQVGEKIRYTVTVTQQGTAPAEAEFTDDLSKVRDDAKYNGDVEASLGTVEFRRGTISWNGTIPVGGVAEVTYSVTVKSVDKLGNRRLVNPVTSPGCAIRDGETINCETDHRVPKFDLELVKSVVGRTLVKVGGPVKYRLVVTNNGPDVAPAPIRLVDRLPRRLELQSARGKGWDCTADKARDKVVCKRDRDLDADKRAAPVFVVAKATKAALGREVVNAAQVSAGGDLVLSNNRDTAPVKVRRVPPPSTGFRMLSLPSLPSLPAWM